LNLDFLYGVFSGLTFWWYVLIGFLLVQVSMMAVTLYLHRDATHRSVDLHPALRHFFRLWIWMTSGQLTREWVAVHRKHHAFSDQEGDPHSPVIYGLKKILLEGAEVYRVSARDPAVQEKYGRGTPDDWMERNVYSRHRNLGIVILVLTDIVLFGAPGIIILSAQLIAMPLFAAGGINGLGHATGYRNFECDNAARNMLPWGLLIGGEELHNNHHAFPTSAKFSAQPWEVDIGWGALRLLEKLGLARIRRVMPEAMPEMAPHRTVDLDMVKAVIATRMHILRDYAARVTLPVLKAEVQRSAGALSLRVRKLLVRHPQLLDSQAQARLQAVLVQHKHLHTVHEFRERLSQLWSGALGSNERLVTHLHDWIAQAEASGIESLQQFAARLRGYRLQPAVAAA
jgi:stearoyl-CoA desaturase (delta-9 desaturase)